MSMSLSSVRTFLAADPTKMIARSSLCARRKSATTSSAPSTCTAWTSYIRFLFLLDPVLLGFQATHEVIHFFDDRLQFSHKVFEVFVSEFRPRFAVGDIFSQVIE